MDEYVRDIENQAAEILAEWFDRRPTLDESPVLELVTCLLEDGAGGFHAPRDSSLSTAEWLRWNWLMLQSPQFLLQTANEVLTEEQFPLPQAEAALQDWALWLLVSTLDKLPTASVSSKRIKRPSS